MLSRLPYQTLIIITSISALRLIQVPNRSEVFPAKLLSIVVSFQPRFPGFSFPSPQMPDQQQTLSVPSLLLLAAFAALTIRYFFFTQPSTSSPRTNPRAANPADVEQIATMFPQIGRREIIWDLQRNGGSVNATTERILGRGSLDPVIYGDPVL